MARARTLKAAIRELKCADGDSVIAGQRQLLRLARAGGPQGHGGVRDRRTCGHDLPVEAGRNGRGNGHETDQGQRANLRVREIEEIKSVPCAPVSHPFVERLIGTIRREYLDRVLFWNAVDLERKLEAFRDYYNDHRVHRALAGLTPAQFADALSPAPAALDHYGWQRHCQGLLELPIAA
jgi:hypothetical protein